VDQGGQNRHPLGPGSPAIASSNGFSRPGASYGIPGRSSSRLAESYLTRTLFGHIVARSERLVWRPT